MIQYKLFKYAPLQSPTPIILGILFHEPSLNFREFRFIQDFSRLSQLYPEIDVVIVEKLLRGIKEEVGMWNSDSKPFDIED